ncbi:hypothetical protein L1047_09425 [Synechococcus sp. Nb3U1]|uniref:hypothetical protein n=1 Tax=Synechococcus sp. Nb3U1 TaxID=1914529 RepID=UPI001F19BFFB|nr:hypothetical protein [Synechococcus sp. Nb3U1]MCF2971412.1 hypothetical protein [Synechococcus sp. Nb3U1]
MRRLLWIAGFVVVTVHWPGVAAFADQASYISRADAIRAGNRIDLDQEVRFFCQPCGDTQSESLTVDAIAVYYTGLDDYYSLYLNDFPVDLAYTYILHEGKWNNMAMLLELEVTDVPQILPDLPMVKREVDVP